MRAFNELSNQMILATLIGLICIQVCVILQLYLLAGMMVMTLVLVDCAAILQYYLRKRL